MTNDKTKTQTVNLNSFKLGEGGSSNKAPGKSIQEMQASAESSKLPRYVISTPEDHYCQEGKD